jgi:type I restriction enzyme S subunit
MGKRSTPYIAKTERSITDAGLQNSSARLLPPQSVILSSRAPIGHLVINTSPMATNQGCKGLVPSNNLDTKYLYYYLAGIVPLLNELGTGATFKELSGGKLKEVPVPVAPLPEQHRIVGILDEAFDGIATVKASAEKNLQNTHALFESHLQSVFTARGEGWQVKSLDEVCEKITDGTHHSPKIQFRVRKPGLFPYITSKNIRNNFMDLSNVAYIEREFHEEVYARCQPNLGDVLLTKDGASTGNVTLNSLDEPFSLLSSVCLIKTKKGALRPAFLCYYIQSPIGLRSIVGQMTGAAIKRIVLKDIKKAAVPFPDVAEQDSIVGRLDTLLNQTQRLEFIYQQKLTALDDLKKSLLHHAFSGKL